MVKTGFRGERKGKGTRGEYDGKGGMCRRKREGIIRELANKKISKWEGVGS